MKTFYLLHRLKLSNLAALQNLDLEVLLHFRNPTGMGNSADSLALDRLRCEA